LNEANKLNKHGRGGRRIKYAEIRGAKILLALRWLNTVFDTCVSFTFFSKTLDPLVAKNFSKQVNNTNFGFLIVKLTYVPLPWQHK